MRGVDFYPWKDFVRALVQGAATFKRTHGYLPPLAVPKSFNEHIFVRKFFAPMPMPSLADKLAAKDYVRARLGEEFLPAVAWVGEDVGSLAAAKLPAGRYVLKPNHASTVQYTHGSLVKSVEQILALPILGTVTSDNTFGDFFDAGFYP